VTPRRAADDTALALGPLEARLMRIVWGRAGELSVRDVRDAVPDLAYTTVMTTLDRLFKKGLLARRKSGRAFRYAARLGPDELRVRHARGIFGRLLAAARHSPAPVFSALVDSVASDRQLDDLERLVRERRAALRKGGR